VSKTTVSWTIAADSHFKTSEPLGRINPKTKINTRTEKKLEMLDVFLQKSVDFNVDFAVYAGDLFNGANPPQWLRRLVAAVFHKYLGKLQIVYLPGNHDDTGEVGAWESEGLLSSGDRSAGFCYIDKPTEIELVANFLFVPYRDRHQIPFYAPGPLNKHKTPQVVISHLYVEGSDLSKTNLPLTLKGKGMSRKVLSKFPLVMLGDIHKPQAFSNGDECHYGIHYCGCLSRVSIDDGKFQPGFLKGTWTKKSEGSTFHNFATVKAYSIPDWTIERYIIDPTRCPNPMLLPEFLKNISPFDILELEFVGPRSWLDSLPLSAARSFLMEHGARKVLFKRMVKQDVTEELALKSMTASGTLSQRWESYAEFSKLAKAVKELVTGKLEELI